MDKPDYAALEAQLLTYEEAEPRIEEIRKHLEAVRQLTMNLPGATFIFRFDCFIRDEVKTSKTMHGMFAHKKSVEGINERLNRHAQQAMEADTNPDFPPLFDQLFTHVANQAAMGAMLDDNKLVKRLGKELVAYMMRRKIERAGGENLLDLLRGLFDK